MIIGEHTSNVMVDETPVECLKVHMTKVIDSMKPNERDVLYRQVLEIIDAKRFNDMVSSRGQWSSHRLPSHTTGRALRRQPAVGPPFLNRFPIVHHEVHPHVRQSPVGQSVQGCLPV